MRPRRIKVEGFASYRAPIEVDLTHVEFFSISGATGSGKSSLVDAMIFALYGRIPKLGARAVAPVITAGAERARVAFDFEVGEKTYTAVRLAQRTKSGGATVKEARLQAGEKVLADGASDVTAAVEELLRLRFEDFTRTVVLPQGEFARFLTADKAERQSLLRSLLGLDVYTAMRSLARTRESIARDRVEGAEARIDGLEIPGDDVVDSVKTRLELLKGLSSEIVGREKSLAELRSASQKASALVDATGEQLNRLRLIAPPERLDELDTLLAAAQEKVSISDEALSAASDAVAAAEAELGELPTSDAIEAMSAGHRRLAEARTKLERLDSSDAAGKAEKAEEARNQAKSLVGEARAALEAERLLHAAHALTETLEVGEACPVCDQEVSAVPDRDPPGALVALEERESAANAALDQAAEAFSEARAALAASSTARTEVLSQIEELEAGLADAPGAVELAEIGRIRKQRTEVVVAARAELERRRADARLAERELEDFSEAVRAVSKELMAAHQAVAELSPPLPDADEAIGQWKEFLVWRDEKVIEVGAELDKAVEGVDVARERAGELQQSIVDDLSRADVPAEEPYAVAVTRELEVARAFMDDIAKSAAEKKELESLIETASAEAAVAGALASHLKADGFERWLMAGAIADLVDGANERLEQLSGGGYSLASDESGSFSIIDHRNANEARAVATLSGGETFLVSLALALSLAETLAARGGADLDAIIIDEGFGTLDEESLDTVASVLEDLAGGLMVGVITHVKELAGRAPTRFEVAREPGGSKVQVVS